MKPASVLFLPQSQSCAIRGEESVLELALKNEIAIEHSCGGMGSCTTCRVIVESPVDELPPRNELESDIAEMRAFEPKERLSCQLAPFAGLVVRVPIKRSDF